MQFTNNISETTLMNAHRPTAVCVIALVVGLQALAHSQTASENTIRMNQIQVIGSHNSYHAGIAPSESRLFQEKNLKLYQAAEKLRS
jgi:hypothetical protein